MKCASSERTRSGAGSQVSRTGTVWLSISSQQMWTRAENGNAFKASLFSMEAEREVVRGSLWVLEEADLSSDPSIPTSCRILISCLYKGLEFSLPGSFEDTVT